MNMITKYPTMEDLVSAQRRDARIFVMLSISCTLCLASAALLGLLS